MGGFQAICYKEWIKLRTVWLLLLAAQVVFALFIVFRLYTAFRYNDAVMLWSGWVFDGQLFFSRYAWMAPLSGILLAVAQFLPEVQERRIRLTLHLPVGEERVIALHLLCGLLLLGGLLLPALVLFAIAGSWYFPPLYPLTALSSCAPWLLAGVASYLMFAAIQLEMLWRYRVVLVMFYLGLIQLYYLDAFYGAYAGLWWLIPATFSLGLIPLACAYRFRRGMAT